jgi:hypothetical protein
MLSKKKIEFAQICKHLTSALQEIYISSTSALQEIYNYADHAVAAPIEMIDLK